MNEVADLNSIGTNQKKITRMFASSFLEPRNSGILPLSHAAMKETELYELLCCLYCYVTANFHLPLFPSVRVKFSLITRLPQNPYLSSPCFLLEI